MRDVLETFFVSLLVNFILLTVLCFLYGGLIFLIFNVFGLSRELGMQELSFLACYLIALLAGILAMLFRTKVNQK